MACETPTTLGPTDDPSEFSRAPSLVTFCDDGRAALDEMTAGPVALALFLGAPSRAGASSGAGSLNRLHG